MTTSPRPWYIKSFQNGVTTIYSADGKLIGTMLNWQEAELVIALVNGAKEAWIEDEEARFLRDIVTQHRL